MLQGRMMASSRGPVDINGMNIPGSDQPGGWQVNQKRTMALHRAMASAHYRNLVSIYGDKVKPYDDDEIALRAYADVDENDTLTSGAYANMPFEMQCEKRSINPTEFAKIHAELRKAGAFGAQYRAIDGSVDTALTGVEYDHQWWREFRLAGELLGKFPKQMEIPVGFSSYTGPVVGDALWLRQGPILTNSYTTGTAYNPTSTVVTLTPQKAMAIIFGTGELTEDSLAPIMENIKQSMVRGGHVMVEHVIVNGDTTDSSGNINCYNIAGPADLGDQDPRRMMDGLRAMDYHSAVGKTANTFSGVDGDDGIVTIDDVTGGLAAMGKYASNLNDVLTITNKRAEFQVLQDPKLRPDTYSPIIRAADGKILTVCGSQWVSLGNSLITNAKSGEVPSYESALSEGYPVNLDAEGLYSGTGNTKSGLVHVNVQNIIFGWKRQFTLKVVDLPLADQWAIVCTMRFQMKQIIAGEGVRCSYGFKA